MTLKKKQLPIEPLKQKWITLKLVRTENKYYFIVECAKYLTAKTVTRTGRKGHKKSHLVRQMSQRSISGGRRVVILTDIEINHVSNKKYKPFTECRLKMIYINCLKSGLICK